MCCVTEITLKMETEMMAAKALELMKDVLAQADGLELDSRKTIDRFAETLMVQGSAVVSSGEWGLESDTNHIVLPEMFKAVARCFCFDKFTAKVFSSSSYVWEAFEISYEDGELVIKGLTYEYMKKYILAHDDEKGSIMAIFHELRGNVVSEDDELQAESLTYGEIKMWFLDTYPEIKNFHESRADRIKAIKEKQKLAAEAKAKAKKVA